MAFCTQNHDMDQVGCPSAEEGGDSSGKRLPESLLGVRWRGDLPSCFVEGSSLFPLENRALWIFQAESAPGNTSSELCFVGAIRHHLP